jgi:hypothetical protein
MVKIIGTESKVNPVTKEQYNLIVLLGNVEVLKSKSTGKPYLTAKKVTMPTTLTSDQAEELVGTSLPGEIEMVDCPEYEIKMPGSNKKVRINHSFQFVPSTSNEIVK